MTREYTLENQLVKKNTLWMLCGHLKVGDVAKQVFCEEDSCGPLCGLACCPECAEVRLSADQKIVHCVDCQSPQRLSDDVLYYPRDFDPYVGTKALVVCHTCRMGTQHQQRLADDAAKCMYE